MNYFKFHIGDYASATRHLSWDEDMAYRRLLDAYYMREAPLPLDMKHVYRLTMATSKAQRHAVDVVLAEFFTVTDRGYCNDRCEEEIAGAATKTDDIDARRADERERQRRHRERRKRLFDDLRDRGIVPPFDTTTEMLQKLINDSDNDVNVTNVTRDSHDVTKPVTPDATANHYPLPTTHKEDSSSSSSARDLLAELRKAAGWEQEPHPNLFITGPIEALLQNGVDLDLDVLPTIRAIAPQAGSRTTWKYFLKAIVRARNDRLAAISLSNDFSDRSPTNGANRQKHSRTRNFAILDAIVAEAERREDEEGGGSGENLAPRAA